MSVAPTRTRRDRRLASFALASAVAGAWACSASAQIATLDKGHSLLVDNGLQIWGLVTDKTYTFNYSNMAAANFNAVVWSYDQSDPGSLSTGQKWGKWVPTSTAPGSALNATETAHSSDLVAIQVGDEQQGDMESPSSVTTAWFQAAHTGNYFQNQLLYVNSFFIGNDSNYANFIAQANPDAISWDGYPFSSPAGSLITPQNWLVNANHFRRHALGSYIGATGNAPRPYGMYLQTYHGGDGARDPGDVEMRWQQFTAWTLGYTFVDTFTAGGGNTSLFVSGNQNSPNNPRYTQFQETARQSRNLGPALTRLISYGYGPSIVPGKNSAGVTNGVPGDWLAFSAANAPTNQQYLTSLSAQNIGTKNNAQPGDIYVGFFNPLHASFGDPTGEAYFMVTNALGAYLDDPTATVADCTQQITMNLDTQYSGISTLQRLRRSDGQLEIVPLTRTTARQYQLQFNLEGGTGDLFKYNDGTPFVGFNNTLTWDADGAGAGTGGSGNWDAASARWNTGSGFGAWAANRDAVFSGSTGTVTLASPQAVNSLSFKSNGYTVNGSTLTMAGQFITTDNGVTTTIGSTLAGTGGIVKAGPGTLVLSNNANTYTGGTTVTGGVLQISADGAMGPAPASFTAGNIILNGGTLKFGANLDINSNRGIYVGPNGGTIDTQAFSTPSGYSQADGIFGPGDLTKLGSGTFIMSSATTALNNGWTGNLILKEGTWKIFERGGLPYNANNDSVYRPSQIKFDGGTLQIGANISVSSQFRGITIGAGGGTFDTQAFNFTWGGPVIGNVPNANFNKIGSGTLTFTSAASTGPATYSGNVNINGGTITLAGGTSMGDLASINLANVSGATLNITGSETVGSLAGGGGTGGNVTLSAITFTTGGNNNSTTFGGAISGNGGNFVKAGNGIMTLSGPNTYTGTTTVNAGTLLVNGTHTGAGNYTVAAGATLGGTGTITLASAKSITINGTLAPGASIESLDVSGGNVTLAGTAISNFEVNLTTGAFDELNVNSGQLTYGGVLNVTFSGANPSGGTFDLFDFTTQTGSFSSVNFINLPSGQSASFNSITGVVTVVPEPAALSLFAVSAVLVRRRRR